MDLNGATWMVRQLEQSVSMVHLDEHQGVFAGGWDGRLSTGTKPVNTSGRLKPTTASVR